MKALAVWPQSRVVRVIDHPEPMLTSPGAVGLRTIETGVCGTDAEICSFHMGVPPSGSEYLIVGHEAIAEVEEVGADVSRFKPGDLAVPSVRRPCPRTSCQACRSGNQDLCTTGEYTERGMKGLHGFLAERFVEDERYLHFVPAELRPVAVLTEPLTIAEKALRLYLSVTRRLPWTREMDDTALLGGKRAVVLGAGPIGLLGCMLLLERGCRVWVYSREPRSDPRALLVEAIGAGYVCSEDVSLAELATGVGRPDLVYEATGAPSLLTEAAQHLAPNGVLLLAGLSPDEGRIEAAVAGIVRKLVIGNQAILGTVNASAEDFETAIRDLGAFCHAWPGEVRKLITGRHPLDDFCSCALDRRGIKEVISMPGAL